MWELSVHIRENKALPTCVLEHSIRCLNRADPTPISMEVFYKRNSEDPFSSYPPGLNFKLQCRIVQAFLHRFDIENITQSYQKYLTLKPRQ